MFLLPPLMALRRRLRVAAFATALSAFAFAIGLASLSAASPAAALSSIDVIWRSTGTSTVAVSTSNDVTLIADIVLKVESGASTVSAVGLSFVVDEDSENELDVLGVREFTSVDLPGMGNVFNPLLTGTNTLEPGCAPFSSCGPALIELFDQGTLDTGATPGTTATLGSIKFSTNYRRITRFDGGPDVRPLVQLNGFDGIVDSTGNRCVGEVPRNDCPYEFNGAFVIPEPTTSALIVVGLGLGLFYSRRRQVSR
jgi:hypothetical protein